MATPRASGVRTPRSTPATLPAATPAPGAGIHPVYLVGGAVVVSLFLRAYLPFSYVFTPGYVNVQGTDAWYHLRLIEALTASFPERVTLDPYVRSFVPIGPLLQYLSATLALVFGAGSPGPRVVHTVAAWVPVLLGTAMVPLAYVIGRRLFGVRAGLCSAWVVAVLPGPYLDRVKLGFTDHHATEIFFTTAALAGLMLATRRDAAEARVTAGWKAALLAGLAWGAYLLAWTSSALLAFIVVGWVVAQYVLDYWKGRDSRDVGLAVFIAATLALLLLGLGERLDAPRFGQRALSVSGAVGVVLFLEAIRQLGRRARLPPAGFVAALAAAAGAAAIGVTVSSSASLSGLWTDLSQLSSSLSVATISEARPLFYALDGQTFSFLGPWYLFRSTIVVGVAALGWLAWRVWRDSEPAGTLLFVWAAAMLVATLARIRFGYYLAVPLALLTGWACAALLDWMREPQRRVAGSARARAEQREDSGFRRPVAVLAMLMVLGPTALAAVGRALDDMGMPAAWHEAYAWMRDHTPPPFPAPDAYDRPSAAGAAALSPAYTVMSQWVHGYWIVQTARRVPVATPTQAGADTAARFLLEPDPAAAEAIAAEARSRYVVVSDDLVLRPTPDGSVAGDFSFLGIWLDRQYTRYFENFVQFSPGRAPAQVTYFYPEYYQTMINRLATYDGAAVRPTQVVVITWQPRPGPDGPIKELVAARDFTTYDAAKAYFDSLGPGNHNIVGRNPVETCVPLEVLANYRRVYESPDARQNWTGRGTVRIFERAP